VTITAAVSGPGEVTASVGDRSQVLAVDDGEVEVTLAAEPSPGVLVVPEGEPVDVVLAVDGRELHYLARVVDGQVQVIEPPVQIRHYQFPGHAPVDVDEDVSRRIRPT
jgi:hypothetical protein